MYRSYCAFMMKDGKDRLEKAVMSLSVNERRDMAMQLIWSLPRIDVVLLTEQLSKTLQKDIIAALPAEISFIILSKLNLKDLLECTLVSHTWASRCQDQALWAKKCLENDPPILPSSTTWSDISTHRALMYPPPPQESIVDDELGEEDFDYDPMTRQSGMSGGVVEGRPHYGWSGLRRSVWERSTPSILPSFSHNSPSLLAETSALPRRADHGMGRRKTDPLASHIDSPDPVPLVKYKHLYIVHWKLLKRKRYPAPATSTISKATESATSILSNTGSVGQTQRGPIIPKKLDAVSSIQAGGLPGHSEIIYSLQMIRHRMDIKMAKEYWDGGQYDTLMTLSRLERGQCGRVPFEPVVSGRNWILSGSRDKTMRLWALDVNKPKVVKVFHDGHDGSILSLFAVSIKGDSESRDSSGLGKQEKPRTAKGTDDRLIAVTGGSDGRLCMWDIANGDGTPEKMIDAHSDSVLCVRGNEKRIVSCSKDRTVRVFSLPNLNEVLCIPIEMADVVTGTVNAVGVSDDYIVAVAGDRLIRVWSIQTGEELTRIKAHSRGIASVSFDPTPSRNLQHKTKHANGRIIGTIATGSSDASVKLFGLVAYPNRRNRKDRLSFEEMMEEDRTVETEFEKGNFSVAIEKLVTCTAPCCCPPGLARLEGTRCSRCLNRGHMELVRAVCLDSMILLSGSYDGSVRVWDRDSGRALADLSESHSGRVFAVVGDKVRIASAGLDAKILLWDFGQGLDTSFVEP